MGPGRYRVPVDWEGCPKMGQGLVQDLFLTFKTPLTPALNAKVHPDNQFHLRDVFLEMERLQKDTVLWIDLTNTERYYPKAEVIARKGFTYIKMPMLGHGQPPTKSERDNFNLAVDTFLAEYPHGIVGVHCTHGFNRTGFLISNYLMARKGLSAHGAMTEFKIKRPPGIYRKNYVEFLYEIETKDAATGVSAEDPGFVRLEVEDPPWMTDNQRKSKDGYKSNGNGQTGNPNARRGVSGRGGGQTSSQGRSLFAEDELVYNFDQDGDDPRDDYNPRSQSYGASNYSSGNHIELDWRNQSDSIWNGPANSETYGQGQRWHNNNQYQFQQTYRGRMPLPPHCGLPYRPISHQQFRGPRLAPAETRLNQFSNWNYARFAGQPVPFNGGHQNGMVFPNPLHQPPTNSRKRRYRNADEDYNWRA